MKSNESELRRRLRKSLLTGAVAAAVIIGGFFAVRNGPTVDDAPSLLRSALDGNGALWGALSSNSRTSVTLPEPAKGKPPRLNGDLGLTGAFDFLTYRLSVESGSRTLTLKMPQIEALPSTDVSTLFKCIEGWSEPVQYSGLKFSDFMDKFGVGRKSDGSLYKYVGLETPDGEYYVSIDMKSMRHPQTVLAYEMNRMPLRPENGAPLRLIIPIKYGIKSLKRVGRIFFSDERPDDYWAERGYDWFAGL